MNGGQREMEIGVSDKTIEECFCRGATAPAEVRSAIVVYVSRLSRFPMVLPLNLPRVPPLPA